VTNDTITQWYNNFLNENVPWRPKFFRNCFSIASGLDGFPIAFFWFCWAIVKDHLLRVFTNFHELAIFEKSLNATFIALIPKRIGQFEAKDFRPMSLVGSVNKILVKVLAIKMKQVLGVLISKSQNAFIRGTNSILGSYN
jgi:hypothetical protein